jgi:Flp pilus assembly protein TadG
MTRTATRSGDTHRNAGPAGVPGTHAVTANPVHRARRRAAASVELAVLMPLIAFLFVVTVDFARIFYYSQVVENCARQGALYLSDPKAPANNLYADVSHAALADAPNLATQPTVTSGSGTDAAGNSYVTCTVKWDFTTITGFPGVPNKVTLTRTVQMRLAQQ